MDDGCCASYCRTSHSSFCNRQPTKSSPTFYYLSSKLSFACFQNSFQSSFHSPPCTVALLPQQILHDLSSLCNRQPVLIKSSPDSYYFLPNLTYGPTQFIPTILPFTCHLLSHDLLNLFHLQHTAHLPIKSPIFYEWYPNQ